MILHESESQKNKKLEMKKIILLLVLTFSLTTLAQNKNLSYFKITQKECLPKKGYQLVLKEVISDSRCPDGVNCIWVGEIKLLMAIYQDKQFVGEETITLSDKNFQDNKKWLSPYLSANKRNIESIDVVPYPKEGLKISPKDYYLKIGYIKTP